MNIVGCSIQQGQALNPTIEIGDFVEKHQASVGSVLHRSFTVVQ